MRCYGLSKQERKYEVVSGKPVIAPIKRTIYVGVMTSSWLLPVLSTKTTRHPFRLAFVSRRFSITPKNLSIRHQPGKPIRSKSFTPRSSLNYREHPASLVIFRTSNSSSAPSSSKPLHIVPPVTWAAATHSPSATEHFANSRTMADPI